MYELQLYGVPYIARSFEDQQRVDQSERASERASEREGGEVNESNESRIEEITLIYSNMKIGK